MEERRKARRIELDLTINYRLKHTIRLNNLSSTGIKFSSSDVFHAKDFLVITFSLDVEREIKVIGKIVRIEKTAEHMYAYGLEFWHIEEEDRILIDRYVSERREHEKAGLSAGN